MRTRLRWRLTAALLVTLFAVAGCKQIGGNGFAVSGSSGAGALTVHPGFRVGGVWVGQHRGTAYRWLPAAAAGAVLAEMMRNLLGGTETGYGSLGEVPFGSTDRCKDGNDNMSPVIRDLIVVERWVGPGGHLPRKLYVTCKFIRKIWRRHPHVTGKQILECLTWLFARGEGQIRTNAFGEIERASPAGKDWVRCAEGG